MQFLFFSPHFCGLQMTNAALPFAWSQGGKTGRGLTWPTRDIAVSCSTNDAEWCPRVCVLPSIFHIVRAVATDISWSKKCCSDVVCVSHCCYVITATTEGPFYSRSVSSEKSESIWKMSEKQGPKLLTACLATIPRLGLYRALRQPVFKGKPSPDDISTPQFRTVC